jgi:RNA-directed DNA polymerase
MNFIDTLIKSSSFCNKIYQSYYSSYFQKSSFNSLKGNFYLYKHFNIPKLDGTFRTIQVPSKRLKNIQYKILEYLSSFDLPEYVFGLGGTDKSAKANAEYHCLDSKVIIKMDIRNFFSSTTAKILLCNFYNSASNLPKPYFKTITGIIPFVFICMNFLGELSSFYLPTGAPTSPLISSLAFLSIDEKLNQLAKDHNLKYSRYIDDLTFSGPTYPPGFQAKVNQIVKEGGYHLNHKKSQVLYKNNHTQKITGISLNNKEARITREYRRQLRTELEVTAKSFANLSDSLYGKLAYVKQINVFQYTQLINYFLKRQEHWNNETNKESV